MNFQTNLRRYHNLVPIVESRILCNFNVCAWISVPSPGGLTTVEPPFEVLIYSHFSDSRHIWGSNSQGFQLESMRHWSHPPFLRVTRCQGATVF